MSSLAINIWYLDDKMSMGSPEDFSAALHIMNKVDLSLGLYLNKNKEEDSSCSPLQPEIFIHCHRFTFFGCPISLLDYCEEVFQETEQYFMCLPSQL